MTHDLFAVTNVSRLYLSQRTGDLSLLDTHAIVSCNNESFTDSDPQTTKLLDSAGPQLRQELANSIRGMDSLEVRSVFASVHNSWHNSIDIVPNSEARLNRNISF